jgi:hypothetical protein
LLKNAQKCATLNSSGKHLEARSQDRAYYLPEKMCRCRNIGYFGNKRHIFLGTSGTSGTRGTSGRWCDIFSGNHMYYQPTLYTCQRIYSVRSGKNLVFALYMSYVCITNLPENILLRLLPIGRMEKKKPLAFLQRVSLLTTKNKRLNFYCLWHNPHSVHNIILLLGG